MRRGRLLGEGQASGSYPIIIIEWEEDRNGCSLVFHTLDLHAASQVLYDLVDDVEADACTLYLVFGRVLRTIEARGNVGKIFCRYSYSVIPDSDRDEFFLVICDNFNAAVGMGEFYRIGEQVQ